jgi:hypothetical protein
LLIVPFYFFPFLSSSFTLYWSKDPKTVIKVKAAPSANGANKFALAARR